MICFSYVPVVVLDPCNPNPCQLGGTCIATSCTEFTCQCVGCNSGDTCQECKYTSHIPICDVI